MKNQKQALAIYVLAAIALLVAGIFYFRENLKIVNVHESIENFDQIGKLDKVMFWTGMDKVVLAAIPDEMLHYTGGVVSSYTKVDENEDALKDAVAVDPDRFSYFCTVDPNDFNALEKVETCMKEGAVGVKIYDGYKNYHVLALDNQTMLGIFSKIAENNGILLMPVSTTNFLREFENMLRLNPTLPVICSHYCLSSKDLARLTDLMSAFPNLYVDTSFGYIDYAEDGFETIGANKEAFRTFFNDYQDRILFATDNVITGFESKDRDWLIALYRDYISILTESEFESRSNPGVTYAGLDLPKSIQSKVFSGNWNELTAK